MTGSDKVINGSVLRLLKNGARTKYPGEVYENWLLLSRMKLTEISHEKKNPYSC